jgi:hypothetical protein
MSDFGCSAIEINDLSLIFLKEFLKLKNGERAGTIIILGMDYL